jgi:hypothetical protein
MTLLDRLKPEYREKLDDYCIKLLKYNDYYIDLKVGEAQLITLVLTGKNLELGILQNLFYEIKDMKL